MGPLAPTPCPLGPPTAPPPCTMTWRVPTPQALGHPTPEAFSTMVQSPVLSQCHPPLSGSTCMMCHTQVTAHRLLCPGYSCREGVVSRTPPGPGYHCTMLRPWHGTPVRHAGGVPGGPGELSQARHGEAGSRREPAQPQGLGVCRARCVLGSPGGTYPALCPRSGARGGLPGHELGLHVCGGSVQPSEGCRHSLRHRAPWGFRLGPRALSELSRGWDHSPRGCAKPGTGAGSTQQEPSRL